MASARRTSKTRAEPSSSGSKASRRTGPLTQTQREKTALMRKVRACDDCHRRRVACKPSHRNLTWEEAIEKIQNSKNPADVTHLKEYLQKNPEESQANGVPRNLDDRSSDRYRQQTQAYLEDHRSYRPDLNSPGHSYANGRPSAMSMPRHDDGQVDPRSHQPFRGRNGGPSSPNYHDTSRSPSPYHPHQQQQYSRSPSPPPLMHRPPPVLSVDSLPSLTRRTVLPPLSRTMSGLLSTTDQPKPRTPLPFVVRGPPAPQHMSQSLSQSSYTADSPSTQSTTLPGIKSFCLDAGQFSTSTSSSTSSTSTHAQITRLPLPPFTTPSSPVGPPGPAHGSLPRLADMNPNLPRVSLTTTTGRYQAVLALFLYWQHDTDTYALTAMKELADVFGTDYHYQVRLEAIPLLLSGPEATTQWMSQRVAAFVDGQNDRDTLKVVYYTGPTSRSPDQSLLLTSRPLDILAGDDDDQSVAVVPWARVQSVLEEATSDVLLAFDSVYAAAVGGTSRGEGVFEVLAAASREDEYARLGRGAFTRALTDILHDDRMRRQDRSRPAAVSHVSSLPSPPLPSASEDYLSAAVIHLRLARSYAESRTQTRSPMPLPVYFLSGNPRLPSVAIGPVPSTRSSSDGYARPASREQPSAYLTVTLKLDSQTELDGVRDWLRTLPAGVREAQLEGPHEKPPAKSTPYPSPPVQASGVMTRGPSNPAYR